MLGFSPLASAPLADTGAVAGNAYNLTANAGSFALTGQTVDLNRGLNLAGGAGSFVLTGQNAGILIGEIFETGAFALSGQTVGLNKAVKLSAGTGSFTLTGQSIVFINGKSIVADVGNFALAGEDSSLVYIKAIVANPDRDFPAEAIIDGSVSNAVIDTQFNEVIIHDDIVFANVA